jgi:NAD dependent epimerase/dehydratase family
MARAALDGPNRADYQSGSTNWSSEVTIARRGIALFAAWTPFIPAQWRRSLQQNTFGCQACQRFPMQSVPITGVARFIGQPYQHPEKLIPLMIIHALEGKPLPIYGDGSNVRDWLHVSDHSAALMSVIERGRLGETYNVGGGNERNNREVVAQICDTIDAAFAADKGLAALSILSSGVRGELPDAHHVCDRPAGPRSSLCDRRFETRDRNRQSMQRRVRGRIARDRALVPRPGRLVGRRDRRRLPDADRQELRLGSALDHPYPRLQQRGIRDRLPIQPVYGRVRANELRLRLFATVSQLLNSMDRFRIAGISDDCRGLTN